MRVTHLIVVCASFSLIACDDSLPSFKNGDGGKVDSLPDGPSVDGAQRDTTQGDTTQGDGGQGDATQRDARRDGVTATDTKPAPDTERAIDLAPDAKCPGDRDCDGAPDKVDCKPDDPKIFPNQKEVCNGFDDNCNNLTDEEGATGCSLYYLDQDQDSYGTTPPKCLCRKVGFYTATRGGDCYDKNRNARPGQTSYYIIHRGDGSFDYNCDGAITLLHRNTGSCAFGAISCKLIPGFYKKIPGCGAAGEWINGCKFSLTTCNLSLVKATQQCR